MKRERLKINSLPYWNKNWNWRHCYQPYKNKNDYDRMLWTIIYYQIRSQFNNINLHLKELEKEEQTQSKVCRKKDIKLEQK
jgi:hypothetical protein